MQGPHLPALCRECRILGGESPYFHLLKPKQPQAGPLLEGTRLAGPILPKVPSVRRKSGDPAPSAYLMLKPVVWSSLSQLCSFVSSL